VALPLAESRFLKLAALVLIGLVLATLLALIQGA
jgi:hypothetical protein